MKIRIVPGMDRDFVEHPMKRPAVEVFRESRFASSCLGLKARDVKAQAEGRGKTPNNQFPACKADTRHGTMATHHD